MILTSVFLKVRAPKASIREKLKEMDWMCVYVAEVSASLNTDHPDFLSGILIIVGSTVSLALAFTWGGLKFPWASANVLVPMIIGAVGIFAFFVAERYWLKGRTVNNSPRNVLKVC